MLPSSRLDWQLTTFPLPRLCCIWPDFRRPDFDASETPPGATASRSPENEDFTVLTKIIRKTARDYCTLGRRNGIDCRLPVTEIAGPMVGDDTPSGGVRSGNLNNPIFTTHVCT